MLLNLTIKRLSAYVVPAACVLSCSATRAPSAN